MEVKMKYSLYKSGYSEFHAHDYNPRKKEIVVELPDYKRPRFPASWKQDGAYYLAPSGVRVQCVGSGYGERFRIFWRTSWDKAEQDAEVNPGLKAREKTIALVESITGALYYEAPWEHFSR